MSVFNEAATFARILREMPEIAADEEALLATLESETNFAEAVNLVLKSAKEDEATAKARAGLADDYRSQGNAYATRARKKREAIARIMGGIGIKKLSVECGNVSLVRGRTAPRVVDADALPQGFFTLETNRVADMDAIKSAVAEGDAIPGVIMHTGNDYITVR